MKNIRIIIIGFMVGGAVGARFGAYLSTIMEVTSAYQWVEAGMIIGSLSGIVLSAAVMLALAFPSRVRDNSRVSPVLR